MMNIPLNKDGWEYSLKVLGSISETEEFRLSDFSETDSSRGEKSESQNLKSY